MGRTSVCSVKQYPQGGSGFLTNILSFGSRDCISADLLFLICAEDWQKCAIRHFCKRKWRTNIRTQSGVYCCGCCFLHDCAALWFSRQERHCSCTIIMGGWEACTVFISAHGTVTVTPTPLLVLFLSLPHIPNPPLGPPKIPSSHLPSAVASFSRYALPVTPLPVSFVLAVAVLHPEPKSRNSLLFAFLSLLAIQKASQKASGGGHAGSHHVCFPTASSLPEGTVCWAAWCRKMGGVCV